MTAEDLISMGVIEKIIEEPRQYCVGANNNRFYRTLQKQIYEKYVALKELKTDELLERRYENYRKIGRDDKSVISKIL